MKDRTRVGIVGPKGFMGTKYFQMLGAKLGESMRITGLASRTPGPGFNDGNFDWVAQKYGDPAFQIGFEQDLQRFTGPECGLQIARCQEVDFLILATPATSQGRLHILEVALENGKHVLVEKPWSLDSRVGQQMLDLCSKYPNQLVLPAHCYRFWAGIPEIKKSLQQGALGKVLGAHFQLTSGVPPWSTNFADSSISGGGLFDFGIHFVDLIYWLLGSLRIREARGSGVISGAIDQASVNFGSHVTLECGWNRPAGWFDSQFVIHCEKGNFAFNIAHGGSMQRNGEAAVALGDNSKTGWLRQLEFCADWIQAEAGAKPTPPCTPAEALAAVKRCEQIVQKIGANG